MSAEKEVEINVGGGVLGVLVVIMLLVAAVFGVIVQVDEGYVGVKKEFGAVSGDVYQPGIGVKVPVRDSVQYVEVRPRTYTMSSEAGEGEKKARNDAVSVQTINGTNVDVDVTVRYRVSKTEAAAFVAEWNNIRQLENRLVRPTVRNQLRDEAAGIPTTEIYTAAGRDKLAQAAREALSGEFNDEAVVLEAVQVRKVDLPAQYDDALNEKEIAKQRVQREKYRVEQEKQKAQQKRIQAEADADVIRIKGEALNENAIILKDRLIDAYGEGTVFVTDGDTPIIMDTTSNKTAAAP